MKMSICVRFVSVSLIVAGADLSRAADIVYSEWLSDAKGGSGGWSDATRWKDGKLPSETGNVKIGNADAWIADADAKILGNLSRIRFSGTASLEFRFEEDQGVGINTLMELTSGDRGRIVKTGEGNLSLTFKNTTTISDVCVSNGTLSVSTLRSDCTVRSSWVVGKSATLMFNESKDITLSVLVCDGAVTNAGSGKISVGKLLHTDSSSWILPENVIPMEDVIVSQGTFVLHQPLYTYYRIIFKENGNNQYLQTYGLRMNDAQTNYVNSGFTYNSGANGDPSKLNVREIAYHDTGTWTETGDGRGVAQLATGKKSLFSVTHNSSRVRESDRNSWVGAIMRLEENAPAVVSYDFAAHCNKNPDRTPRKWTFEGSRDGSVWDLLHSYSTNEIPASAHGNWVSSDTADFVRGFPVAVGPTPALTVLPRVTVSGGATVKAEYAAEINSLVLDCGTGGNIDGCVFAERGTIDLVGLIPGFSGEIGTVSFENVIGLENLAGWTLMKGGRPCRGSISVKNGKLWYTPSGMVLIFR